MEPTDQKSFTNPSEEGVQVERGCAIPNPTPLRKTKIRQKKKRDSPKPQLAGAMAGLIVSIAMLTAGVLPTNFSKVTKQTASAISSYSESKESAVHTPLRFGSEPLFSQPDFFFATLDKFVAEKITFIEANLQEMQVRYYEQGELIATYPIKSKGKPGSWWETPAGLYEIKTKNPKHFSSFGNVYLPWSMPFQGNFFIHGGPEYPSGEPVTDGYSGGCIRLGNEDAEALYERVEPGIPILVHETTEVKQYFQYEPRIPEMENVHYLIADVKDATVLASSDLDTQVPIASLTKLMTALIAAEFINLDSRVSLGDRSFVQSLVPRLSGRNTVSMYSLLQLLLLESSNEAADVIANQLGRAQFINRMNEKAFAIGMHNTVFTDPSGLDDGNVSTLGDLLRLVQYIQNNRSFILKLTTNQYVDTAYQGDEFGELENFNEVADLEDFYAGKVGETEAAGQTSITLHKIPVRKEERIITIIVLNSKDRDQDVSRLHSYFLERALARG